MCYSVCLSLSLSLSLSLCLCLTHPRVHDQWCMHACMFSLCLSPSSPVLFSTPHSGARTLSCAFSPRPAALSLPTTHLPHYFLSLSVSISLYPPTRYFLSLSCDPFFLYPPLSLLLSVFCLRQSGKQTYYRKLQLWGVGQAQGAAARHPHPARAHTDRNQP